MLYPCCCTGGPRWVYPGYMPHLAQEIGKAIKQTLSKEVKKQEG